jgi:hypothetical protein
MGKLQELVNKLKDEGSIANQEQAILRIVRQNESVALDLNTSQLFEGKDAENKSISPPYSPLTIQIKRFKNQPTDRVTLKDEGEFYQKFTLLAERFPVMFDSNSFKTPKLTEKYGSEIFGLIENSKAEFVEEIKPEVQAFYSSLVRL